MCVCVFLLDPPAKVSYSSSSAVRMDETVVKVETMDNLQPVQWVAVSVCLCTLLWVSNKE